MPLPQKPLEQLIEADLQQLVEDKVAEQKTIEYKKELPKGTDEGKRELLADVTSLANAAGGDIFYGIDSENGIATSVVGISDIKTDEVTLRLESIVLTGVQPRIVGVHTRAISLKNGNAVLVMRVPRSWNSPHMVTSNNDWRFYTRNSAGKHRMDVTELRHAFLLGETTAEKIRNFRLDRLAKIAAGETPVPMQTGAKIVIHLVSLSALETHRRIDLSNADSHRALLKPPHIAQSWDHRHNFDGLVAFGQTVEGKHYGYVQLFRNGIVESVDGLALGEGSIPGQFFEAHIVGNVRDYLRLLKKLEVEAPILVMVSWLSVRGLAMDRGFPHLSSVQIDRDDLIIGEQIFESYDANCPQLLRPAFDAVWNACGYERSPNYDANGNLRFSS